MTRSRRDWWDDGRTWALFALASVVPFLFADIPGLVDLPTHIAAFHVTDALDRSPYLQRYYGLDWTPVANLGANLLVMPLIAWLGVERAGWLVAAVIPPLTVVGLFAVARAVHRRVPPTALVALPLVYGFAFAAGFINYALSIAIALLAFAAWVRTADAGWIRRALVFAPSAVALCLIHISGWGVLCLLAAGFELDRALQRGRSWSALRDMILRGLPLAAPLAALLPWTQRGDGMTYFHENLLRNKITQLSMVVRQDVAWLDVATACILVTLPLFVMIRRSSRPVGQLGLSAVLIAIAWLATPIMLMGSFYADYRLAPVMLMVLVLSLGQWRRSARGAQLLAIGIVGLFVVRLAVTTTIWEQSDRAYQRHLTALELVPRGARVAVLTPWVCPSRDWRRTPMNHLGSYAITRRDAFTNTLWATPGGHLTRVKFNLDTPFHGDPSQVVLVGDCRGYDVAAFPAAVAAVPRDRFDFIWILKSSLVTMPPVSGADLVYADDNSQLYAIDHASSTGRTS